MQICFEHENIIGGSDSVVEIVETFLDKRKYNRGRLGNQKIMFGGIQRDTKDFFIKIVPRRNSETLREAIIDFIRPNTIVYSDK